LSESPEVAFLQFPEIEIPMKDPASIRFVGSLFAVWALLSLIPTVSAAGPPTSPGEARVDDDRELTAESFAAYAAGTGADRGGNALSTTVEFAPREARFVRLVIRRAYAGTPCLDELEVYGPNSTTNLALASRGAVPRASSAASRLRHPCRGAPE
jgi:hypothetical protein